MRAASLSTLATYLKAAAPRVIGDAAARGTFQALLDLRRVLHLSAATIGYLQAFVRASSDPKQARRPRPSRCTLRPLCVCRALDCMMGG
jgi:hypothetical protein